MQDRGRARARARAQQGSLQPLRPQASRFASGWGEEGVKGGGEAVSLPPPFRTGGGSGPTHAVFFLLRWDPHAAPPAAGAAPEAGSPLPEWSS